MSAFVLVHGGLHGAWCWEGVAADLREAGHHVQTPDLPGRDATSAEALACTLSDNVATLSAVIADAPEPPVVVAHSMGGVWATQLASQYPGAITAVVYVSAVIPSDGRSALQTWFEGGEGSGLLAPGALVFAEDKSTVSVPRQHARALFFGRCSDQQARYALDRIGPEPLGPLATPISIGASFDSVTKVYIGATEDAVVTPLFQHELASRHNMPLWPLEGDHSLFFSARDRLVQMLSTVQ